MNQSGNIRRSIYCRGDRAQNALDVMSKNAVQVAEAPMMEIVLSAPKAHDLTSRGTDDPSTSELSKITMVPPC